jgi:hypothetical protein
VSPFAIVITVVVGVAFLNQVLTRVESLWKRRAVYLSMQTLNLVTGAFILVFGLPGFENNRPASILMGVIFFFRAFWNRHERTTAAWEERQRQLLEEQERLRAWIQENPSNGDD